MMDSKHIEELARACPDLVAKAHDDNFGVGNGWFNIIRTLCGLMSYDVHQARYKLKYAMDNQGGKYADPIDVAEARLAKAIEDLPTIVQVKEKFGGLRFYMDGGTPELEHYVTFAEAMASRTCEICGKPGESRNTGWIKTLCDTHHNEVEAERASKEGKVSPNLFED
jgi:hypothetical protein